METKLNAVFCNQVLQKPFKSFFGFAGSIQPLDHKRLQLLGEIDCRHLRYIKYGSWGQGFYPVYLVKIKVAFVPPKPNEFVRAISIWAFRA